MNGTYANKRVALYMQHCSICVISQYLLIADWQVIVLLLLQSR